MEATPLALFTVQGLLQGVNLFAPLTNDVKNYMSAQVVLG